MLVLLCLVSFLMRLPALVSVKRATVIGVFFNTLRASTARSTPAPSPCFPSLQAFSAAVTSLSSSTDMVCYANTQEQRETDRDCSQIAVWSLADTMAARLDCGFGEVLCRKRERNGMSVCLRQHPQCVVIMATTVEAAAHGACCSAGVLLQMPQTRTTNA